MGEHNESATLSVEEFLLMEGVHSSSGMPQINFEAMLEEINVKIVEVKKRLEQTSIVLPIDNDTKPRLYNDREFLEDLIIIMRYYQETDYFSSMGVLQKIGTLKEDFKYRCSRVFRDERYRLAPPLELDIRKKFETDFELEEEINTFIYGMVAFLVNEISDTHPKKDMDKRKVLLLNLSLSIDSRELKEFYYSLREKEIADYVPSLSTDVKKLTIEIFFKLSKDLLSVIREDFAMISDVIDNDFLVEMFVSLYLNKYTIMLGDICLDLAESLYNHRQSPRLPDIIEIFELALDFQENVAYVIDKKKKKQKKEQKLSVQVPKQVDFTFGPRTFIFGHENFVTSTLNGITVEIVFVLGEVCSNIFNKEISFEKFTTNKEHPILKDVKTLVDRLIHIITVFTTHNLLDFKNNFLKKICYGFSALLGKFEDFLLKKDFEPKKLKNLYVAYSTLLYCCDSVCFFGSLYNETEHNVEKTFDFTQMNTFYREKSKTFRAFIIEYHSSIISMYCVTDVRYLMDWDTHRKFLNDDRCSYGIQMWNYYMKCTCKELFKSIPDYFSSDLFSELIYNSAKTWNDTYSNIFPTTKKKILQFRNDISFLIMYIRSFRGVLDSKFEKSINRECLKLLVYMAVLCAPLTTIKTFLENINSKEGNMLSAKFAVIYQQSKPVKYIKGIPILVWNSPKFNPMFEFDHLMEYNRIGNTSNNGLSNEIDFSEVKNISFDFPMLLHGYYIFGISILSLCNRILLRCEYNDNDYPPPTDEEKVLREDIKGLIATLK